MDFIPCYKEFIMSNEERKARELANNFISKSVFDMTDKELKEQRGQGKKFAIICVNEILENIEATKLFHKESKSLPLNEKYWLAVKEAINSL